MVMATKGTTVNHTVSVGHVFPPGTRVDAYPRLVDRVDGTPAGISVASAKVDDRGDVTVKGLVAHAPYFLSGTVKESVPGRDEPVEVVKNVQITAVDPDDLPDPNIANTRANALLQAQREGAGRDALAQQTPELATPQDDRVRVIGARSTLDRPTPKTHSGEDHSARIDPSVLEPQPHPKQEDVKDSVPQRSSTPAGQATPREPGELQPRPSQSDIKPGTPQRSDTPFGEATPKDPGELQPGEPQENVNGPKQRSDTPHGTAAPKPATKSVVEQEKARESSVSKAQGSGSTAVAGTDKTSKKAGTKTQRAKAADPVKPAAKRAAKKGK